MDKQEFWVLIFIMIWVGVLKLKTRCIARNTVLRPSHILVLSKMNLLGICHRPKNYKRSRMRYMRPSTMPKKALARCLKRLLQRNLLCPKPRSLMFRLQRQIQPLAKIYPWHQFSTELEQRVSSFHFPSKHSFNCMCIYKSRCHVG